MILLALLHQKLHFLYQRFPKVYEAITSHENSVSCADDKLSTFAKKPVLVSRRAEKGLTGAKFSPLSKCVTAEI